MFEFCPLQNHFQTCPKCIESDHLIFTWMGVQVLLLKFQRIYTTLLRRQCQLGSIWKGTGRIRTPNFVWFLLRAEFTGLLATTRKPRSFHQFGNSKFSSYSFQLDWQLYAILAEIYPKNVVHGYSLFSLSCLFRNYQIFNLVSCLLSATFLLILNCCALKPVVLNLVYDLSFFFQSYCP